jgi:DNA-binding MarR family transcriptional regulator
MSSSNGMPEPMARRLGYVLKRAQNALRTRMDDALRPLGITAPQYAVLTAIELEPGLSNAALARAAFVTPQTMQGIVANLERDGLLQRSGDPAHGRILKTELTPHGAAVLAKAHAAVADVEAAMIGTLSAPDVIRLTTLLATCADNFAADPG